MSSPTGPGRPNWSVALAMFLAAGCVGTVGPAGGGITGATGGNVPFNQLYVTPMNAVGCKNADGSSATGGITNPGEVAALKA